MMTNGDHEGGIFLTNPSRNLTWVKTSEIPIWCARKILMSDFLYNINPCNYILYYQLNIPYTYKIVYFICDANGDKQTKLLADT